MNEPKVVAIDFDGTIADYTHWKGPGEFEKVLPGAAEEIKKMKADGHTIIIHTNRGVDINEVTQYLTENDISFDHVNENPDAPRNTSDKKIKADVYIDDRAMNFSGRWAGMADKVNSFDSWCKSDNRRPSMNIEIAGYRVDQVSLYVRSIKDSIEAYQKIGHGKWVTDIVTARETIAVKDFVVGLAFNYTLYPCEFELLQVIEGSTVQVPPLSAGSYPFGLSHYGFHVDNLEFALEKFNSLDYETLSIVKTKDHSSCPDKYIYAFVDTTDLGFISKLIIKA